MSSTRDRNCPGDYALEQKQNTGICGYSTYTHSAYGNQNKTFFPGNGLLPGRVAPTNLAFNACDIESYLYGIGSSNLVNPSPPVRPDLKPLDSLSVMKKTPLIIPEPLVIAGGQRPYPLN